ncbi:MAG: hypothetical protein MUF15_12490, partial [Acidobacteria bacterium]|nr:hypothetical protein [Acidobacteriota bacterium]
AGDTPQEAIDLWIEENNSANSDESYFAPLILTAKENEVMKIEKIKIKEYHDDIHSGPSEIIRLGLKIGDYSFLFGSFYFGQYQDDTHYRDFKNIEKIIDELCNYDLTCKLNLE